MISIDSKKKELIGNFASKGQTFTQTDVEVFDHDFPSAAEGHLIPHGIYDLARNKGYIHLNTSKTTIRLNIGCFRILRGVSGCGVSFSYR